VSQFTAFTELHSLKLWDYGTGHQRQITKPLRSRQKGKGNFGILTSPSIQLLCDIDEGWKIASAFLAKWREGICASSKMFSVALTKSRARIARIPRPDNQSHRMKKIP